VDKYACLVGVSKYLNYIYRYMEVCSISN